MARYDLTRFMTTHNSYSGGARGSIPGQLDLGVRDVELDFHDNGYDKLSDYRVGHLKPGSEVALGGGNPDTPLLRAWLGAISSWSAGHPGHAPITVTLDAKDDLTDNDEGDLEDLNRTLESAFGPKLFTREERDEDGAWPETEDLRGRILCVLSGDGSTRASYRWTQGSEPAIAANGRGDVVLAYRSSAGDLVCWTGTTRGLGVGIEWRRKAAYAIAAQPLRQPAIALDGDGWVVEAHSFGPPMGFEGPLIEGTQGRLQDDGRIEWYSPEVFAAGSRPRISLAGDEVEVTTTMWDGQRMQRTRGLVERRKHKVKWRSPRPATPPLPPPDAVGDLRCEADAEGVIRAGVGGDLRPVRFRQLAFVEEQKGDDRCVIRDALFFAAGAKNQAAVAEARARGLVTRAWGYEEVDLPVDPTPGAENMPATDTPRAAWYADYMAGPGVAV